MNILCTGEGCPIYLSSKCVFYEGETLTYTNISNNDSLTVALQKIDEAIGNAGTSGGTGTSGSSGTSGATGSNGTSGTSGATGSSGASGSSGTSGQSGSSGTSGETGTSGQSGSSGTSGLDGSSGTSGGTGSSGQSGTSGTSGVSGSSGTSGLSGTSGIDGTNGTGGTSGSSGLTGTSGTDGTSGVNGTSGTDGTSGITGTSGTSGNSVNISDAAYGTSWNGDSTSGASKNSLYNIIETLAPKASPVFTGVVTIPQILYDGTPDVDETVNGPTTNTFLAGESVTKFELVYFKNDGKWWRTDANSEALGSGMLGISMETKLANASMLVALAGSFIRNDAWAWTVGAKLFISGTTGAITETAPTGPNDVVRIIGYAISADVIYFLPMGSYVIHS